MGNVVEIGCPVMLECPPGELCQRPYPNHRPGCPNYGKRTSCPPQAAIWDYPKEGTQTFVVWNAFDFGAHVRRMYETNPKRTKRQAECCLYWQGTARKQLKKRIKEFTDSLGGDVIWIVYTIPEAHGVNVTETMRRIGIELEWPPKTVTHQVALVVVGRGAP